MKKFTSVLLGTIGIAAFLPFFAMARSYVISENAQCMQEAVMKRGEVLINAYNAFNESVVRALKDRVAAESNAWAESVTQTREQALRRAEQNFDAAFRTATKTLEREKKAAWQQFEHESKRCRTKRASVSSMKREEKPSVTPSITILSPNGGEAFAHDGSPITVNWQTKHVPSFQAFDVIRLRAYPNGREFIMATHVMNDGQEVIVPSVPAGSYTLEIKTYVNGTLVMDSSDAYFSIIDPMDKPNASEQVKCVFNNSTQPQECHTATADDNPLSFGCTGVGTCVVDVQGPRGTSMTWKSSCGGYDYTTLDGDSEYANFYCSDGPAGQ